MLFARSALPAVAADALPTVDEIQAHVRAAAGPRVPNYREVTDATAHGIATHSVSIHSGRDYRTDVDAGPLHTAHGSVGGQSWHQNENGETVLTAADPGFAVPDTFVGTVARIASPVSGYVASSSDPRGVGYKRYVDAATWHVVRIDAVRPSGTTVTTYDDFRTVDGSTRPYHLSSTDGHAENDVDSHVTSFAAEPVDHNALAVPKARRTFVEFPAGTSVVDLPAREVHGKFIVRVDVGSRGLDFVLDSGDGVGIVIEDGVFKELGIPVVGTESNGFNAGRFRQTTAVIPSMKVGSLTMRDVVVHTVPSIDEQDASGQYRAVGLLGFDFIDAVALKLDYVHGTVTAYDPATFHAPDETRGFDLDLRLGTQTPNMTLTIDGAIGERFMLDTGGYGTLLVFDSFVRRNATAMVDEGGGVRARPLRLRGIGGEIETKAY